MDAIAALAKDGFDWRGTPIFSFEQNEFDQLIVAVVALFLKGPAEGFPVTLNVWQHSKKKLLEKMNTSSFTLTCKDRKFCVQALTREVVCAMKRVEEINFSRWHESNVFKMYVKNQSQNVLEIEIPIQDLAKKKPKNKGLLEQQSWAGKKVKKLVSSRSKKDA